MKSAATNSYERGARYICKKKMWTTEIHKQLDKRQECLNFTVILNAGLTETRPLVKIERFLPLFFYCSSCKSHTFHSANNFFFRFFKQLECNEWDKDVCFMTTKAVEFCKHIYIERWETLTLCFLINPCPKISLSSNLVCFKVSECNCLGWIFPEGL